MTDTLLIVLIVLMSLTLLGLAWGTIALLLVARYTLPAIRREVNEVKAQVNTLNQRALQVLDELIPAVQHTTLALKEAERALHEAAETIENLHIVSDNVRHKLEVADEIGAKVRRLPEKAARLLGKLMHQGFKLGGRLISHPIERRLQPKRATVYNARSPEVSVQPPLPGDSGSAAALEAHPADGEPTAAANAGISRHGGASTEISPDRDIRAPSEDSAPPEAERVPTGEATTHTTHKEG